MKKVHYIFLYILPIFAIVGIILYFTQRPNADRIGAVKLISHYREDAYGANESYGDKCVIVTGKIKEIAKKGLSHQGFTNQFEITIVLYGESLPPASDPHAKESQEQETEKQKLYRKAKNFRENYFSDEVICSFHRSETYSLRNLKKDDIITIQGEVVDNGLRDFSFDESFIRRSSHNSRLIENLLLRVMNDIKEGLTYSEREDLGLTGNILSLPLKNCTLVSSVSVK
ncbi:hypothetical protein C6501_18110 [Candidatus Poribacteria bacterium]|nr:MAG: hypothetical protein C6501_18110 [Candidatus Poribacteria bacterium]